MSIGDASGCVLTRRGRRLFETTAAGTTWVVGAVLLVASGVWDVLPMRMTGAVLLFAATAYSIILAVNRHDDLIRTAFEMGREDERAKRGGEVAPIRR